MPAGTDGYYSEHEGLDVDRAIALVAAKQQHLQNLPQNTNQALAARIPTVVLTQAEYDALTVKEDKLYFIKEEEEGE